MITLYSCRLIIENTESLKAYLLLSTGIAVCILSNAAGVFVIGAALAYLATDWLLNKKAPRSWRPLLLSIAAVSLLFYSEYTLIFSKIRQFHTADWIPPLTWPYFTDTLIATLFGWHPPWIVGQSFLFWTFCLLLPCLFFCLLASPSKKGLPFLAMALTYLLQIVLYSHFVMPIVLDRTLLPILPPLLFFVAIQISECRFRSVGRIAQVGVLLCSLQLAWFWVTLDAQQPMENLKSAAQKITSQWKENDLVVYFPSDLYVALDHYVDLSHKKALSVGRRSIASSCHLIERNVHAHRGANVFLISRESFPQDLVERLHHALGREPILENGAIHLASFIHE